MQKLTIDEILQTPKEYFKEKGEIEVVFDNKKSKKILKKLVWINYPILGLMRKYNLLINELPINLDTKKKELLTDKHIKNALTKIYLTIIESLPPLKIREYFIQDVYQILKTYYKEFMQLYPYLETLDLLDAAKIAQDPEIQKFKTKLASSFKATENQLHKNEKKMFEYFKKTQTPLTNIIGFLNPTQVYNTFGSIGFKTDIDDTIIPYYIESNLIDGMLNEADYLVESLAAKKASFYNKSAIKDSQYFNRKQQLICSTISHLYDTDCGSDVLVPYHIANETIFKALIGKKMKDEQGNWFYLKEEHKEQVLGKVLWGRSPLTCRYTNGVCKECLGLISYFIPSEYNLGQVCCIHVTEPITQRILSSKHFQKTNIITWKFTHPDLMEYFIFDNNKLYLKRKDFKLVLTINEAKVLLNLKYLTDISFTNEKTFGEFSKIGIWTPDEDLKLYNVVYSEIRPYFSQDFLEFLYKNFEKIVEIKENYFVIDISKYTKKKPIFKTDIYSDSMVRFVKTVSAFFEIELSNYTSIPDALNKTIEIIFNKVVVPIPFIEVILKAYLITDDWNFDIPVVTDINNVKFALNVMINSFRHLSVLLTFQNFRYVSETSRAFSFPFRPHIYDYFLSETE